MQQFFHVIKLYSGNQFKSVNTRKRQNTGKFPKNSCSIFGFSYVTVCLHVFIQYRTISKNEKDNFYFYFGMLHKCSTILSLACVLRPEYQTTINKMHHHSHCYVGNTMNQILGKESFHMIMFDLILRLLIILKEL